MARAQDEEGRRHGEPPVERPCGQQIPEMRGRARRKERGEIARREENAESTQSQLPAVVGAGLAPVRLGLAHVFEYRPRGRKSQALGPGVPAARKCATLFANSLIQEPTCSSLRRMSSSTSRTPATSPTAESAPWSIWRSAWDGRCSSKARRASARPSWPRRWPRSPTGG